MNQMMNFSNVIVKILKFEYQYIIQKIYTMIRFNLEIQIIKN